MRVPIPVAAAFVCVVSHAFAQNGIELASDDGFWKAALQPRAEFELWHVDVPAPGLLEFSNDTFFAPRLVLGLDLAAGTNWYAHAEARWDRGFDAGARSDGEFRVDEAFLRWRPLGDERLNVQAGKFATVFGGWVARHDFWDNPFLDAPLPYNRTTSINDRATPGPAAILARRGQADEKKLWLPVIWGPSYGTGFAIFGSVEKFDYAVEVKNAALASRPDTWSPWQEYLDHPTVSGRLGWRPSAMWAFGLSASQGSYLLDETATLLPSGTDRNEWAQTVIGADARWAWHQFQISGEVIAARFDTPYAGDLDVLSYYIEGRWKVNPSVWLAARWGQEFFNDLSAPGVSTRSWDRDTWRAEVAIGVKITPRVLAKLQYSHTQESGEGPQGENAVGFAFGVRY